MKKNYLKLMAFLFVAVVCVGLAACGDDDSDDPSNTETPIKPVEPTKNDAMSSSEQKEYLEKVASEFLNMTPASDFREISELGKFIDENYVKNYDWNNVENWAKDVFEAAREALGTNSTERKTVNKYGYTYEYNYFYSNYKAVLLASNFTGHFTAHDGRWTQEAANDLQFIFADKRGQQCVLKLETGGSVREVYLLNIDDRQGRDYNYKDNTSIYNYYYDRTQCIIGVPESIVVTLTQGGSQVVKTTVRIDLGSINGDEFDISKNSLTLSSLVELNNGYKFNVSNVAYTANTNALAAFTMSKSGTALVTISASSDVYDIPSVNVSAFSSKSYDKKNYDFEKVNGKNTYVKLDILGKVQIQGTLSDIRKFVDYLNEAKNNYMSESNYKSYINQANSLADVNLFYNGDNVKQASIKLEPFADEKWNGLTYWEAEPVICFYDGSSYSTLKAFFNEKEFKKVIDTFKTLTNDYANLVDKRLGW
jgi:hypothetical protein